MLQRNHPPVCFSCGMKLYFGAEHLAWPGMGIDKRNNHRINRLNVAFLHLTKKTRNVYAEGAGTDVIGLALCNLADRNQLEFAWCGSQACHRNLFRIMNERIIQCHAEIEAELRQRLTVRLLAKTRGKLRQVEKSLRTGNLGALKLLGKEFRQLGTSLDSCPLS